MFAHHFVSPYPESWVEQEVLNDLTGQFAAIREHQEAANEAKYGGEELKREVVRGSLAQQVP